MNECLLQSDGISLGLEPTGNNAAYLNEISTTARSRITERIKSAKLELTLAYACCCFAGVPPASR
jgi:hypothetical protein